MGKNKGQSEKRGVMSIKLRRIRLPENKILIHYLLLFFFPVRTKGWIPVPRLLATRSKGAWKGDIGIGGERIPLQGISVK